MKCLYCEKNTYYEPYSARIYVKIHRCVNCNAQFTIDEKSGDIAHRAFFVDIKGKSYHISQYLPSDLTKGSTNVSSYGEKILKVDFIENLNPSNAEKKLRFWLTFS